MDFDLAYRLLFAGTVATLLLLEAIGALQRRPPERARRWTSNVGLFLIGGLLSAFILPLGVYAFAASQPPGPFARLQLPLGIGYIATFVFLDLWRYWEHRLFHRFRILWRWHLVHHSDTSVDVTTSERHHPVEAILGTIVLAVLVAGLGLPASGLAVYLLVATFVSLYSHANLRLPAAVERGLALVLVTPGVHVVHHSSSPSQTDSNYGAVLTVWDRLFGTYVDPLRNVVAFHGLEYFHQPRDTGLAGVLMQPLRFRHGLSYPSRESTERALQTAGNHADAERTPLGRAWKDALMGGAAGTVLLMLLTWPTLVDLVSAWGSESYQYAWLVVPTLAYVLWSERRHFARTVQPAPALAGIVVVALAAAGWTAASLMTLAIGREVAFVVALHGIALSALGWPAYRRLFPALALTFLLIPSGDVLQPALRTLTVQSMDAFAGLAGIPHRREGFVMFVGTHRYIVIDECAGLAFVTLALFLGYSLGLMLYRTFVKSAVLALACGGLGIASNVVRVNAIITIDWLRDSQMDLAAHGALQWIGLLGTLAAVLVLLARLEPRAADDPPLTNAGVKPDSLRRFAPVLAGLAGLSIAATAFALPAPARLASHGSLGVDAPTDIPGWHSAAPVSTWHVDAAGDAETLRFRYSQDGRALELLVVDTIGAGAKVRESMLAPGAHDGSLWREKQVRTERACAPSGCLDVVRTTWQRDHGREVRQVYSTYSIGGRATASRLALRAAQGWHRLKGDGAAPRLIGVIADDQGLPESEIVAAMRAVDRAAGADRTQALPSP